MTTEGVTELMRSPLVTWLQKFSEENNKVLEFNQLCNGLFLHDVMLQIDPRLPHQGISQAIDDVVTRIRNLDVVVRNVRTFYEEVLGQLVVTKLPDIIGVTKRPDIESSLEDIRGLLLLILGCAVQCDKKEQFIEQIKCLDITTQHAIVDCIQLVTDNPETVWSQDWNDISAFSEEQQEPTFRLLIHHVRRIVKERDDLWHTVNVLVMERDGQDKCITPRGGPPGSMTEKHHMGVELADTKAKLRRTKQELEEKNELLTELKEELELNKIQVNKLKQESLNLLQDARSAKSYRDELDIIRERANRVDKLENEVQRYKDKLNELEFYKSRVEEFREDNRILVETKEMLEEQLENSRRKAEQILELENDLLKCKARINDLTLEKDADRDKIQELIDENALLQTSAKQSMNESVNLLAEIDKLRSKNLPGVGDCMSDQLNKDAQLRLRKLELDNQRLLNILDKLKEASFHESNEKILELEKENKRLSLKVTQLQDLGARELQRSLETEQKQQEQVQKNKKLQEMLEMVKTNSDRQQKELQREKDQLLELVDTLRQRIQKSNDARLKDFEIENKKLVENTQTMKGQISRLEFEKSQLEKMNSRLKESNDRLSEVERLKIEVDRENSDLHQAIAAFKTTCDKYEKLEQDHADLLTDCQRLKANLESMKKMCNKVDRLEQENISLLVDKRKLTKTLESMKVSSQKILDLEQEKEEYALAGHSLRKNLEALKLDRSKFEQMELDLMSQSNENQKLQKTMESCQKRIEDMQNENQTLETENQKMQKNIETLKLSTRRLNDLERENTDLEGENHKLDKEKKSLDKEVSRLKQAVEVKDSTIDECNSKISTLEREGKRLKKDLDNSAQLSTRVKELEKENRETLQQSMMDKKTLIALREDLVSEKIKTQQLSNELENLNSELQKIGLKKEKLLVAEHNHEEDRFKALENMMEEALKKSLLIKEEKICVLESRLEESSTRNAQLRDELMKMRQQYEALQQRMEEEMTNSVQLEISSEEHNDKSNLTKELVQLKDHLTDVERLNATLSEENRKLKIAVSNSRDHLSALQQQITSLQSKTASLAEQNNVLQSVNAKLQVESTTLQSQNTSLSTQFASLSAQNASLEADREQLLRHQEELQTAHEQLVSDHEALQKLHEQLTTEYDNLLKELGMQKTSQKNLKTEFRNLKEQYQAVVTAQEEVERLQEVLESERELLKADTKSLNNLRAEHSRLKEDFRLLHTTNEKLKMEYKGLQSEYKTLKTEHNTLKLKNTELQGELAESRDQTNSLDVEVSKLLSKCEMLAHMNSTLEGDRRSLMSQVTTLLTQYHELLTQTLEDKDHFHEEEKSFADKINNLRRQKEKLEEKIMEQYRRMENYSPKKRGFGATLVRKVRRAGSELMNRVPRSARKDKERSRRSQGSNDNIDALDNESLGSGSVSNESPDSSSDASTLRKLSKDDGLNNDGEFLDHSGHSCYHRHLAFSTTALHSRNSTSSMSMYDEHEKIFRGSFSSEDITSIQAESRSSDGQLGDIDSIASSNFSGPNDDMRTNQLNLGTPGSRRAVYLVDDHDTIPTRDIGPDNDKKPTYNSTPDYSVNIFNGHDPKVPNSPSFYRRSTDDSPRITTLSTHSLTQSTYPIVRNHGSPLLSNKSCFIKSSPQNCKPEKLNKENRLSNSSADQNNDDNDQKECSEEKLISQKELFMTSTPSRKSTLINSETANNDCLDSTTRNRLSALVQESAASPPTNDSPTRNSSLRNSTTGLPAASKLSSSNSSLPDNKSSNLNTAAASEVSGLPPPPENSTINTNNTTSEKPPDNSIWYEYGCV